MMNFAVVIDVLPIQHAVRVAYRDLTGNQKDSPRVVAVMADRAHAKGGASASLPQVGEMGLVVDVDAFNSVWLGSIHPSNDKRNQLPGERFMEGEKHESGVSWHVHRNGDFQLDHPSGVKFRVVEVGGDPDTPGSPLPTFAGNSTPALNVTPAPWVVIDHPKMGSMRVHPDGTFEIVHASGVALSIDPNGKFILSGCSEVDLQTATNRFVMDPILAWLRSHTHTSASSGSPTSAPLQTITDNNMLSPAKFKGPQGA